MFSHSVKLTTISQVISFSTYTQFPKSVPYNADFVFVVAASHFCYRFLRFSGWFSYAIVTDKPQLSVVHKGKCILCTFVSLISWPVFPHSKILTHFISFYVPLAHLNNATLPNPGKRKPLPAFPQQGARWVGKPPTWEIMQWCAISHISQATSQE